MKQNKIAESISRNYLKSMKSMLTDFANLLYPLKTKMILLLQKVLPTFSPELELVKMNLFKRFLGHLGLVSCGTWEHRKVQSWDVATFPGLICFGNLIKTE